MAEPRNEQRTKDAGTRTDLEQRTPLERESSRTTERGHDSLIRSDPSALWSSRDPFTMMESMRRQMDRLWDHLGFGSLERDLWSPQVEMRERNGKLVITADLPGLSKNDVHVELRDDNLVIEGERKQESRDEARGWSERSYGRFYRTIPLPDEVNAESATAKFENGILEVTLDAPKRQTSRGKKIEIT